MDPFEHAARTVLDRVRGAGDPDRVDTAALGRMLKAELGFVRPVAVTAAVIAREDGRVLLARREGTGAEDDHFEFPGGKIDFGETPEECLAREIREELGCGVRVERLLSVETEVYDGRRHILLLTYFCTLLDVDEGFQGRPALAWVDPARGEDLTLPVLPPDRRNLDRLRRRRPPGTAR